VEALIRSELIVGLSARFPQLQGKDAALAVAVILDAITGSLTSGTGAEMRAIRSCGSW
jgi:nucleoid DNA-binding protein